MPIKVLYAVTGQRAVAVKSRGTMRTFLIAVFLLYAGKTAATDAFEQARAAAVTHPLQAVALFDAAQATLSDTPAWYQRDWLVLSSRAYARLQRFSEAEQNLRRADALLSEGISKTDLLLTAGFVNFMQQKFQAAAYWYQCSARSDLPPVEAARVRMSLGQIDYMQGDLSGAKAHFEHSLHLAVLYKQPALQALLQNNLGLVLWRQQQYQQAITHLRQAMYGYTQLQEHYSLQMASLNLLTVVTSQQDWPAFDRYHRSISTRIDEKAPVELQHYLALLQALRQMPQPLPAADKTKLQQLAASLQIPGLMHNAALLLQGAGAGKALGTPTALDPEQDLRLPQLEQHCGLYRAS